MSGSHYPGALLVLLQRTVCTHSNPLHIYPVNNLVTGANSIPSRSESWSTEKISCLCVILIELCVFVSPLWTVLMPESFPNFLWVQAVLEPGWRSLWCTEMPPSAVEDIWERYSDNSLDCSLSAFLIIQLHSHEILCSYYEWGKFLLYLWVQYFCHFPLHGTSSTWLYSLFVSCGSFIIINMMFRIFYNVSVCHSEEANFCWEKCWKNYLWEYQNIQIVPEF